MIDKVWILLWVNKKSFLFGCVLNIAIIFYLGSNIEWKYYDVADLSFINWIVYLLSTIHSVYLTPFGLWRKFIKEHIKPESEGNVGALLAVIYCVFYFFLRYSSGLIY
jgi:hypothetical protein